MASSLLRFVDFPTNGPATRPLADPLEVEHTNLERVVAVETITDPTGFATYRVWIAEAWEVVRGEVRPG